MTNERHRLGLAAEAAVADWLASTGWRIVSRRARSTHGGEVDIVAIDPNGSMVAVEVRARRTQRTGAAAATVDPRRVARLARTLAAVAAAGGDPLSGLRVDLVTVEPESGSPGRWRLTRRANIG